MTREEAIKTLQGKTKTKIASMLELREWLKFRKALDMAIKALEQEPKTGHWILADSQDNVDVENGNNRYICSECTFSDIHAKSTEVPYCWHCGARMEGET